MLFLPKVVCSPTEKINRKTLNFLKKTLLEIEKNIREIIHHNDDYNSERNYYYQFLELEANSFYLLLATKF